MSALYEGCWHKLDRGKKHLDELQHHVRAWSNLHPEPPYTFGKKFNSKRNLFTFHIESIEQYPVEWSLIAGDVLTNFRAALDYLAHDLVGVGSEPKWKGGTKPQFAIGSYKRVFKQKVRERMPGIQTKHRTILEGYQPYKWRSRRDIHPFALLDILVVRDKHREIQLASVHNIGSFGGHIIALNDFAPSRLVPGRIFGRGRKTVPRFEPGIEVARVYGKKTGPDPNVEMGFYGPFSIAFQDAPGWFPDALEGMGQAITKLFGEIEPTL
jgi:hypothetical protein